MDLNGMIYTKVDVDTFQVIQRLGQDIGVIDHSGHICGYIEGDEIATYELDIFDKSERHVLYNQPFDVQFAKTVMSLYQQTQAYLKLKAEDIRKSTDYKTAYKLQIGRR